MTDYNLLSWMIENKISTNGFQSANILNGLKCWKLETDAEKKARILLYRKWRPKTDKKNQVPEKQAFDLAIAGIDPDDVEPRQIDLFEAET